MSDDLNQEVKEFSPDEQRALDNGWVPKEEWDGNPDDWVPAKVFNMRGEFFSRIARDKREIQELKESMNALVEHNKKLYQAGYEEGLRRLKAEKRQALEEGDTEAVLEIDDKIDDLQKTHETEKRNFEAAVQKRAPQLDPAVVQWIADNPWYEEDPVLRSVADAIATDIFQAAQRVGKQVAVADITREVGKQVRERFPDKFPKGRRTPDPVENGSSRDTKGTPKGKMSEIEAGMTDVERTIMKNIIRDTNMTKEKYLEQYQLISNKGN